MAGYFTAVQPTAPDCPAMKCPALDSMSITRSKAYLLQMTPRMAAVCHIKTGDYLITLPSTEAVLPQDKGILYSS